MTLVDDERRGRSPLARWPLTAATIAFYGLHQDFWFWQTAHPLVFGVLPIGLFYHVCYAVAAAVLMWWLVAEAWPSHLEARRGAVPPASRERG
jgi:hypothetical protein